MLAIVGQAMHDATIPPPNLAAHTEGTAAVFQHILDPIEEKIQCQEKPNRADHATYWRDQVPPAAREVEVDWKPSREGPGHKRYGLNAVAAYPELQRRVDTARD